jgi:hypothetical protein
MEWNPGILDIRKKNMARRMRLQTKGGKYFFINLSNWTIVDLPRNRQI